MIWKIPAIIKRDNNTTVLGQSTVILGQTHSNFGQVTYYA